MGQGHHDHKLQGTCRSRSSQVARSLQVVASCKVPAGRRKLQRNCSWVKVVSGAVWMCLLGKFAGLFGCVHVRCLSWLVWCSVVSKCILVYMTLSIIGLIREAL